MQSSRKNLRLPADRYRGRGWYFVTACCDRRRPVFAEPTAADWLLGTLRTFAAMHCFAVHAFCIMPDHIHFLVEGTEDTSDLVAFLRRFKQQTGYHGRRRWAGQLWQKNFYDHVLRPNESPDAVAWYIWMNPVRRQLCQQPEEYPFSGSFTVEWKRQCGPVQSWQPPWNGTA